MIKDLTDVCIKLFHEVIEKAGEENVDTSMAGKIFWDAYHEHRAEYGSFVNDPNYTKRMEERYRFMQEKALTYIETHKGDTNE